MVREVAGKSPLKDGMQQLSLNRTPQFVDEVMRAHPVGWSESRLLAEVMRVSKGGANPIEAARLIHDAMKGGGY